METYSSVLQKEIKTQSSEFHKNVVSTITVKKLGEAIKQATEKEERSKHIVMFGAAEEENQQLESRVEQILHRSEATHCTVFSWGLLRMELHVPSK